MNISVIIPVYNAEAFLEKAVDSALFFDEVKEIRNEDFQKYVEKLIKFVTKNNIEFKFEE